ncbi:DUF7537 family lipoprotein [Halomarina oriensis]|uniref:LppX_LprAFG lipoprotein n=1 Tax=Halomarina oriensis TaxID=671145 RepID=A0A6B0GPS6_9EURY|nr:hypothetical protein [Halomarina oriensis]MWG34105.1 hypothetical protein [Halomarina oriensis]
MRTSSIGAVLLCLVVLAGCSAVPGVGGGEPYTAPDEPLNTTQLQADHTANVEAADSLTYALNATTTVSADGNESFRSATVLDARVDVAEDVARYDVRTDGSFLGTAQTTNASVYVVDGTAYLRQSAGDETRYRTAEANDTTSVVRTATLDDQWTFLSGVNWTQNGTVDGDGETLTRYTANGSERLDRSAFGGQQGGAAADAVTSFEATMLVTSGGTVRSVTYRYTIDLDGRTQTARVTADVSDLNGTSVEEPSWLDAARNGSTTD